jgi:hypothetical protein
MTRSSADARVRNLLCPESNLLGKQKALERFN